MTDLQTIWADAQQRTLALVWDHAGDMGATVPACPAWTAKDLVGHMVGVDTDAINGDVDENFSDRWTDTHVRQRADTPLEDVVAEWEATRAQADQLFGSAPDALKTGMVVDASVHEQDLRGALDRPGAKDQPGLRVALDMFAEGFESRVREHGLPTLHVDAGHWNRTFGEGEPAVRVAVSEYDFGRALSGRRSPAQVRTWAWSDPQASEQYEPYLSGFGSLRDTDLAE